MTQSAFDPDELIAQVERQAEEAQHRAAVAQRFANDVAQLRADARSPRGHDVSSPWLRVVAQQTPPESAMQAFEQIAGILAVSGVNLTLEAGEGDQRGTFVFS